MKNLTILGSALVAIGVIICILGIIKFPFDLMSSNFMLFVALSAILVTVGLVLIPKIPVSAKVFFIWIAALALILYLVGFKMTLAFTLIGSMIIAIVAIWLTSLLSK